jgi:hypothetical protein
MSTVIDWDKLLVATIRDLARRSHNRSLVRDAAVDVTVVLGERPPA